MGFSTTIKSLPKIEIENAKDCFFLRALQINIAKPKDGPFAFELLRGKDQKTNSKGPSIATRKTSKDKTFLPQCQFKGNMWNQSPQNEVKSLGSISFPGEKFSPFLLTD